MATLQEENLQELLKRVNTHVEALLKNGDSVKFMNIYPQKNEWVAIIVRNA